MKYVMFNVKGPELEHLVPIIFPVSITHADAAKWFFPAIRKAFPSSDIKPVSAGFWDHFNHTASGKSESMGIGSLPDDSVVISQHDYAHGIV